MIKGILFDKDGTLIDFYEVWGKAAVKVAKRLCDARRMPERQRMLLREMGVADGRVDPDGALAWKSYRGVADMTKSSAVPRQSVATNTENGRS